MGTETEFKLDVAGERLEVVRDEVQAGNAEQVVLQAHYFDTPDGALAAKGIVLKLRNEGGRWFQTLKARGSGPIDRAVNPKKPLRILARKLNSMHKKVVRGGETFESLSIDKQHRTRKPLKRLRYLAEFVGPREVRRSLP